MTLPPFPSQDLAKLVLGYLAEEQLMTAYDEFLQASPYLDALQNEYDHILMTSLKSILAEYWAVKIYVRTCKPYSLRRRLFGCPNLLEVVKFLIQNVDISKINSQDVNRGSLDAHSFTEKTNACISCVSLNLASCACKSRLSTQATNQSCIVAESSSSENSVETTSLADLPGNHVTTRKKQVKVLLEDSKVSQSAISYDVNNEAPTECLTINDSVDASSTDANQNVHVSNHVGHLGKQNPLLLSKTNEIPVGSCSKRSISQRTSTAGTFQDFSHGVKGADTASNIVPDSNTLETLNTQTSKECITTNIPERKNAVKASNPKTESKAQMFLTVGTIKTCTSNTDADCSIVEVQTHNSAGNLRQKRDAKVTILSDVKVDKSLSADNSIMPAILRNATSTPLMHMQTILINGRPVYRQTPPMSVSRNFTKDEIMAMPTIIVVTTSGSSQIPANVQPKSTHCQSINAPVVTTSAQSLEPLVIDVPADSPSLSHTKIESTNVTACEQDKNQGMLIKTLDLKNASEPKDTAEVLNKNTPQVQPPLRKSSSTPRRTTHVRVLDFNTPRRILQEAIVEQSEISTAPVEVIVSKSPNLHLLANPNETIKQFSKDSDGINKVDCSKTNDSGSSKENDGSSNTVVPAKRHNWDADLRALAITNRKEDIPESRIHRKCRPRANTISKSRLSTTDKKDVAKEDKNVKVSKKKRSTKAQRKSDETVEPAIVVKELAPVIPTINIITGSDWNSQEPEKNQNKSNEENLVETPEMDRISLQNAIGTKLNISDLLETPYKQALYDIQMETPRFLGPDLPDEPLSDIKIMNIPTPRFLNTPKPIQATPSSYSSRPTDYSSGGSYYKPDDQDYLSVRDLGYPASTCKDKELTKSVIETPIGKEKNFKTNNGGKSTRPVRSCAKNVSYYNSPLNHKSKDVEDKSDVASSSSENFIRSAKDSKDSKTKTPKSVSNKRNKTVKKRKTPVKKVKTFIKIKPRRVTPVKKRTSESLGRKRTMSKDKNDVETPVLIPVPTKSRRKSSTPRKLHCAKNFNTDNESPDITCDRKQKVFSVTTPLVQDSDTEQAPLRWSDDGSQELKPSGPAVQVASESINDEEDIPTIKEYITSELQDGVAKKNPHDRVSNLHVDLVKRGFDAETAKIIERDLLDTPPHLKENFTTTKVITEGLQAKKDEITIEKSMESDTSSNLKIVQDDEEYSDEIELSVAECNEDTENYIECHHDDTKVMNLGSVVKLKDKFSMEVCIEDGVVVRLRATPFTVLLDEDPQGIGIEETQTAVNSISNIDKLYTPMKESVRAQVYEIFDSTLTSLDTPLKPTSPRRKECDTTVTEIVLEVEEIEHKEKNAGHKRKRLHSNDSYAPSESKKAKPEAQYLLNSANIQNIDIETVLSKLHGP